MFVFRICFGGKNDLAPGVHTCSYTLLYLVSLCLFIGAQFCFWAPCFVAWLLLLCGPSAAILSYCFCKTCSPNKNGSNNQLLSGKCAAEHPEGAHICHCKECSIQLNVNFYNSAARLLLLCFDEILYNSDSCEAGWHWYAGVADSRLEFSKDGISYGLCAKVLCRAFQSLQRVCAS